MVGVVISWKEPYKLIKNQIEIVWGSKAFFFAAKSNMIRNYVVRIFGCLGVRKPENTGPKKA